MAEETSSGENRGANGQGERDLFERYEGVSERFKSDTRNYLKVHLLDEYETPAQAVIYNILQNANDNRVQDVPLEVRFSVNSRDKILEIEMFGTTGIKDWERYNSLHFVGDKGVQRRGGGARNAGPSSATVRAGAPARDRASPQPV